MTDWFEIPDIEKNPLEKIKYGSDSQEDILNAIAYDMYEKSTNIYNSVTDAEGRDLTYDDYQLAVIEQHEKYGSPNLNLQDGGRAFFEMEGLDLIQSAGPTGYDYEGYNPDAISAIYPTDKKDNMTLNYTNLSDDWLAEMSHAMQFYGQTAETRDSLSSEGVYQRNLYGDAGYGRHIEWEDTTPALGQLIMDLIPRDGLLPKTGQFLHDKLFKHKDVFFDTYDIKGQPSNDHRRGHPTIEYEAHEILEKELQNDINQFLINLKSK